MSYNPVCFVCRRFFQGKFALRFRKVLWRAVWQYDLSALLCQYLLPNGSCGKSINRTRQDLERWFRIKGVELVKAWVATPFRRKIELIRMKHGKVETVGKIEVKERR